MNEQRLAEIEERWSEATPGPYTQTYCEYDCDCERNKCPKLLEEIDLDICEECDSFGYISGAFVPELKTVEYGDYTDMNDADAGFVAHSWLDTKELIDFAKQALPMLCDRCDTCEHGQRPERQGPCINCSVLQANKGKDLKSLWEIRRKA